MRTQGAIIVIPARAASTRLARKLLLRDTGKTVLQHTYENACRSRLADAVLIAAGDEEIRDAARAFGAPCIMTDPQAGSGTDRVAEVARSHPATVYVNVQGDEPELAPHAIDAAIDALHQQPEIAMATLATPIRSVRLLRDPACVKVVMDARGRALYFSRAGIPCPRDAEPDLHAEPPIFFQHIGLYAYRRDVLLSLAELPPSPQERVERLEQLRALHAGISLGVVTVDHGVRGIDTWDDYQAFVSRWSA